MEINFRIIAFRQWRDTKWKREGKRKEEDRRRGGSNGSGTLMNDLFMRQYTIRAELT